MSSTKRALIHKRRLFVGAILGQMANYRQRERRYADTRMLDDGGLKRPNPREPEICSICGLPADIRLYDWKRVTFFCAAHVPKEP